MATSPRGVDEIIEALNNTFDDVDPTIDVSKGPIAVLNYATAIELSRTEQQAAYLGTVYQLENADEIDEDDIEALGNNYALDPNVGSLADAIVTFYRESRPEVGQSYPVPEGALVGTDDERYTFITIADAIMSGDSAAIYYNPTERRYELRVEVEAISIGDDFNLPPGTITSILSGVTDFDGVTNDEAAFGGLDPIDRTSFRNLIWNNLQALDSDLAGRLLTTVYEYDVGATDIGMVSSADFDTFERQAYVNGRTAYDIYVITDTLGPELQTFTALGGELSILIEKPPVQSVQYVMVDGARTTFQFLPDSARAFRGSPRADDRVTLINPLQPGQTVEIQYFNYDGIVRANAALQGGQRPFGNDVLVRLAFSVPIFISARMTATSADDQGEVQAAVLDFTEAYLNDPASPSATRRLLVTILDPADYQQQVLASVPGISTFNVLQFLRLDEGVQDLSVIELDGRTEYPVLSPGFNFVVQ